MTDQFDLPSGLPDGPWTPSGFEVRINDRSLALVSSSWPQPYRIVSAIASIPAMVKEIGRLRTELGAAHKFMARDAEDYESLRALNAEMREALQQALMRMEALCDCSEISGCQDAARRASIRAILAKSQEAAS